jgi:hypothetical protein
MSFPGLGQKKLIEVCETFQSVTLESAQKDGPVYIARIRGLLIFARVYPQLALWATDISSASATACHTPLSFSAKSV